MAFRGAARQAVPTERLLAFPALDRTPRAPECRPDPRAVVLAAGYRLAAVLCLGWLATLTLGIIIGQQLQKGTQLGAVIALGQAVERMEAQVAQQDTAYRTFLAWAASRRSPRTLPRKVVNATEP